MSSPELGSFLFAFAIILGAVTAMGSLFEKLRQPKLVGEILAGILLGPFVFGKLLPDGYRALFGSADVGGKSSIVFGALYWIGLLLLMFLSGTEMKRLFVRGMRREIGWLCSVGTLLPFLLVLLAGGLLPVQSIMQGDTPQIAALIVLAVGVAVTSIPVISRIFHDLGILQSRFAGLILGAAALDDVILWGALAIATALAQSQGLLDGAAYGGMARDVVTTLGFMAIGFLVAPAVLRRVNRARVNVLARTSPLSYAVLVLLAYTTLATWLKVDIVFAALLAGYGLMAGGEPVATKSFESKLGESLDSVKKVAFSVFIPVYFALIGQKLIFGRDFSLSLFLIFLLASSVCRMLAAGAASYLAGFRGLEPFNISIALNARGGPGIVLASVAYEAHIINASFYTALVLTALFTSQAAGAWLMFVLRKGWPLLAEKAGVEAEPAGMAPGTLAA
ncbi:MAG TPA: cation:proton antiporter [Terriglobales bacterium]|nr:cation:proton antiporter [Terriglobales bacterium]